MKKKILAIQGSSLKRINIKTDTSFFLGLEAQRRNYDIYYYEPKDLSFKDGKAIARCSILKLQDNLKNPIKILNKSVLNLVKAKVLLIRNEPPFNQQYINTTFILENIAKKLKIINNPKALREVPEKLFSLRLIKFMPPTLISEDLDEIKKFFNKNKKVVIKPIESYGGNDVKLLNKFHKEKILKYIKKYSHLMFQKFIPQISKGDKRIFIIKITPHELIISKFVASELKKSNIYFAGIDFINGKLIGDINVTSPTGLKTYYDLTGINLAGYFFDNI